MSGIDGKTVQICKEKLLMAKNELLNRFTLNKNDFDSRDIGRDEADQSVGMLAESQFLTLQERIRSQILEVETALAKIERGLFGVCEETEEYISSNRLLALPWTRLSIEGAELRDQLSRKYAK